MKQRFNAKEREQLLDATLLGCFCNCFGLRFSRGRKSVIFRDQRAREAFTKAFDQYKARS